MKRLASVIGPLLAASLLAIGCGDDAGPDDAGTAAEPPAATDEPVDEEGGSGRQETANGRKEGRPDRRREAAKPTGTIIRTGDSQFGEVLFDGDDQAIYLFDKETTSRSRCYGRCAVEWPPVLTEGRPRAAGDVQQGRLGTTRRSDGATQVTYDGKPLYLYFDEGPGEVRCHNVPGFGGLWLALDSSGSPA